MAKTLKQLLLSEKRTIVRIKNIDTELKKLKQDLIQINKSIPALKAKVVPKKKVVKKK